MTGYDDHGSLVPTAGFTYPPEREPRAEDEAREKEKEIELARQEVLVELLQAITYKANAKKVGRRALLMAFIANDAAGCRTQRELAKRMGVTEGRVSQQLKIAHAKWPRFAERKRAKARKN